MSKLDTWVDNKLIQNIAIWLFMTLIFTAIIQSDSRILTSLSIIGFIIPPTYISNLLVLPLFFENKKILGVVLYFTNAFFFTVLAVFFLSDFFENLEWRMFYNIFGAILLTLFFATAMKISRDSFTRRQEEKNAQLKLLKAQLNPHFLFNTLNNLYGLSVIKSDKLPGLMLKLSDLLRYSLYDTKEVVVPLEKEIQYLENYISLEKIRLEDKTEIQFIKNGDVSSKMIAPMLLIVFVENAFKHLGTSVEEKSKVMVTINVTDEYLNFECLNSRDNKPKEESLEKGKSGIGLQNAKKRLNLIYQKRYDLNIMEDNKNYVVKLKLDF